MSRFAAFRRARRRVVDLAAAAVMALAPTAYASGSNMPWETPLNQIMESVQA
jgi:type IV secretory pathway VirB2 component (pilin)